MEIEGARSAACNVDSDSYTATQRAFSWVQLIYAAQDSHLGKRAQQSLAHRGSAAPSTPAARKTLCHASPHKECCRAYAHLEECHLLGLGLGLDLRRRLRNLHGRECHCQLAVGHPTAAEESNTS